MNLGKQFLDTAAERLMIESEGIMENVKSWRMDVVSQIMKELPMERAMFEAADAADAAVLNRYIREFGIDVNVFIDHSQIVRLEGLRRGIWGKSDTLGKAVSFRRPEEQDGIDSPATRVGALRGYVRRGFAVAVADKGKRGSWPSNSGCSCTKFVL
jgi:(2R)-phospho-3-sulfolactate synthase (ComA)